MVIDIKMCRFDNVPWGFRLVGGADYEYPLTVVKVTEGSIAEKAGLCVEDVIVRINDTAATPLTHDEAHRLILSSGSVFYFGVHRENEELVEAPRRFPLSSSSLTKSPTPPPLLSASASPLPWLTEATKAVAPEQEREQEQVEVEQQQREREQEVEQECRSAMTEMHSDGHSNGLDRQERELEQQQLEREQKRERERELVRACPAVDTLYLPDLPDRPCSALSEQTEIKLVEEEIAAVLSGETEVLKEHNVLGVNFYRIFPKPGVCMTSDVLRSLNEEVTKTKLEKERENRKWSTFLQRPDRPVPKSKQQLEAERRAANAYKVKIVKSQPREKSPMPETKPAKEATPPPAPAPAPEQKPEKEAEPEEVEEEPLPTDSEVPNLEQLPDNGNGNGDGDGDELPEEQLEKADATKDEPGEQQQEVEEEEEGEQAATAVEPNEREPEAATVVAAVAKTDEELALEKQLADVQKQLAALSSLPSTIQSTLDAVTKQLAELLPTFKLQQQENKKEQQQGQGEQAQESPIDEQQQQQPAAEAACENNEDKCDANDLEVAKISLSNGDGDGDTGELDAAAAAAPPQPPLPHNEEEQSFKKQKIAFWNRLFNGEHITRQRFRELQSRSVSAATHRVNFMKYQKPERKIDLNRSEVYKVIHHLDRAPVRGIEVRAPLVAAEEDIRQRATLQS